MERHKRVNLNHLEKLFNVSKRPMEWTSINSTYQEFWFTRVAAEDDIRVRRDSSKNPRLKYDSHWCLIDNSAKT